MSYSSLLEAFDALNSRKRQDPASLTSDERDRWKEMRREIEQVLFQQSSDESNDTREFLRVPVSLSARYWTRDELKDRYIPVLGEGGLQIATVDPLPLGTQLDLEIVLAHKRLAVRARGEVVWVRQGDDPAESGMGIRFVDLTYEQKRTIYGLVDDTLRERLLERRRFARVEARLQVQFVFADGFFELQTEDVSLGGLFIATDHLLAVGERIRLVLHVPGERPAVKAVAEVARVVERDGVGSPAGLGVRFVDLAEDDRQAIQAYLGQQVACTQEPSTCGDAVERRRHARMEQRIKLRFQTVGAIGVSYSRDISSGGVFIQTHESPPPLGSQIEVNLIHPVTLQSLKLPGRVVRVVELDPDLPAQVPGVGVSFEDLAPDQREPLQDFLKYYVLLDNLQPADEIGSGVVADEEEEP